MRKTTITLIVVLIFNNCFSQTFKNYELKRLQKFEIDAQSVAKYNAANYLNLRSILDNEQKRKTNKTVALVLTSLSVLTTAFGTKIIMNSRGDREGLGQFIGTTFITAGMIELGASIPLFVASNKSKKERDKLIGLYK